MDGDWARIQVPVNVSHALRQNGNIRRLQGHHNLGNFCQICRGEVARCLLVLLTHVSSNDSSPVSKFLMTWCMSIRSSEVTSSRLTLHQTHASVGGTNADEDSNDGIVCVGSNNLHSNDFGVIFKCGSRKASSRKVKLLLLGLGDNTNDEPARGEIEFWLQEPAKFLRDVGVSDKHDSIILESVPGVQC